LVDFYLHGYISLNNCLISLKMSGNVDCIFGQIILVSNILSHAAFARGSAYNKTCVTLKHIYVIFSETHLTIALK